MTPLKYFEWHFHHIFCSKDVRRAKRSNRSVSLHSNTHNLQTVCLPGIATWNKCRDHSSCVAKIEATRCFLCNMLRRSRIMTVEGERPVRITCIHDLEKILIICKKLESWELLNKTYPRHMTPSTSTSRTVNNKQSLLLAKSIRINARTKHIFLPHPSIYYTWKALLQIHILAKKRAVERNRRRNEQEKI